MFQLIIFAFSLSLISCEFYEGNSIDKEANRVDDFFKNLTSSEELELICTYNIQKRIIGPQVETFFENLRAKELTLIRSSEGHDRFHRICKRIQRKLVAFQVKIVQEVTPCLRNETLAEYEAYIKITNKLSSLICNLDEKRLKILGRIENYDLMMSKGVELLNCARNSSEIILTAEVCSIDEMKLFDCSSKTFGIDNEQPQAFVRILFKFLRSLIECEPSETDRIDEKFVLNFIKHILIPSVRSLLIDSDFKLKFNPSNDED